MATSSGWSVRCSVPWANARPGVDRGRAGARLGALGGGAARLRVDEVAEADALVLVARRVGVGEVVGHGVDARLLGGHARGGGVESFEHSLVRIGPDGRTLSAGAPRSDAVRPARPERVDQQGRRPGELAAAAALAGERVEVLVHARRRATSRSVVASSAPACASSPCARRPRASSQLRLTQIGPRQ